MNLRAQYAIVDDRTLTGLKKLDDDGLVAAVMEINRTYADNVLNIAKLWDGLHFMLTGIPAREVSERPALSWAVIGANMFIEDDDAFFISYSTAKELPAILNVMQKVDLTALSKKFKPAMYRQRGIYPDIWRDDHGVALFCELSEAFQNLLEFTQKAHDTNKNIVFSVY